MPNFSAARFCLNRKENNLINVKFNELEIETLKFKFCIKTIGLEIPNAKKEAETYSIVFICCISTADLLSFGTSLNKRKSDTESGQHGPV